ncbi:ABC transporter ATP-binding protein [Nocardiopsis sp. RSe5-2]|uniref:ABC transporter ATP-binding protein n=1 Tax=Nocardiopsis endophytica TaxID=3018445 RepID=A0ABT4TZ30_9ACTN|nr:ABC transporter ATP-binding protein [Nocardiopsis endophytica]MDA2809494.1 ABC transporter ATP-binding protein [Nocardiopsis endophytica]
MPNRSRTASPPTLVPLLKGRVRPYAPQITLLLALQLVQALGLLLLPALNADIVDHGVVRGDTGYILRQGGLMLAATLVQVTAAAGAVYLGSKTSMGLGRDLRAALFTRVQGFSAEEFGRFGAPSLITRTTNDVQQIQMLVFMLLTLLVTAPLMGVGGIVMALRQDAALTWVLAAAIPVLVVAVALVISAMTGPSQLMQGRIDEVNRVLREQITGIRVIRAFVRERGEHERFGAANTALTGVARRLGHLQAYFGASAMTVSVLASVAVVALGGPRIVDGDMQAGAMIAFLNYLAQILIAVMMAMSVFVLAPRARVAAGRIKEVLDTEPAITEGAVTGPAAAGPAPRADAPAASPSQDDGPPGRLDLSGVVFSYPGAEEPVLHGVDLAVRPGETTAVIGSTGAGKTTLVKLVARLLTPDEGSVRIDGTDVRDMDRRSLAEAVGLIPQRAHLFSGTIASNLRYGDPGADDERLWQALEIAQAADFVRGLPDGTDTVIGQGGTTVSGGQRQRLAIARALVARPRIYVFDDAFSALDTATDAAVRAALDEHLGDTARLVVAQRVSTIRSADRIVVLDAGRVEAVGTHDELVASSATYAEIVDSQLVPEEAS